MNIEKVKLIRIKDKQPIEKSLVNWKNLPANEKAAYRVVGGDEPAKPAKDELNIPEEVKLLRSKKSKPDETNPPAGDEKGNAPDTNDSGNENENDNSAEEKLKADIIARYNELTGEHNERRKVLANEFGLHWNRVESILSNAGKK